MTTFKVGDNVLPPIKNGNVAYTYSSNIPNKYVIHGDTFLNDETLKKGGKIVWIGPSTADSSVTLAVVKLGTKTKNSNGEYVMQLGYKLSTLTKMTNSLKHILGDE